MRIRPAPTLSLIGSAALVAGLAALLGDEGIPLGVPGEWEWSRLAGGIEPVAVDVALAAVGLGLYAGFAAVGRRALGRGRVSRWRESAWVAGLVAAGALAQVAAMAAAPPGYGLAKAITLAMSGSSGYYRVAREEMADPMAFLRDYPRWIRGQDVYHIGTHPPGLFVASRAALGLMDAAPGVARAVDSATPRGVADAFRQIVGPMPRADRAALVLVAALTLLACAATSAPIYLMLRGSGADPATSWSSAALWPLVPSAILFQPTADAAFPLLAASGVALASRRGAASAAAAGAVLAVGMACSLVFLAVGLVVGLLLATSPGEPIRRRASLILLTGAGFLAPTLLGWAITGANPFLVWWANQANHSGFYATHPRSYLPWLAANPAELLVGLGLPASVWAAVAMATGRAPRASWLTLAVLAILTLSGRNLSEVARLWLPFFPMLLAAAGPGQARLGGGATTLAMTVALMAAQVVAMELAIQVVYPVP
ncbi:hypothetical protein [Tautonia plasticadhaerens]|uniref:Uncharacterized protein n=1 Tax=Tautonia plasticadhaerens TaxID=2527974 RepID=A0A518H327_9BACT|nr:hypothetical protein [Tautonia plasticadhaerens]QDV35238.1 hypothetical protein ElP_31410 [Tautonia plasticadhaerens]